MSDMGAWIREQRTSKGLTLAALAKKVGAQASEVAEWEQGILQPTPSALSRLQAFFGVDAAPPEGHPAWWAEAMRLKDEMPLRELAEKLGVSTGVLSAALRKAGVRRRLRLETDNSPQGEQMATDSSDAVGRRSGSKDSQIEKFFHLLGNIPDSEVARLAGVSVRTVASYRSRNDIAGYTGPRRRPQARGGRQSKLDDYKHLLGKLPDRVVADEAGMSLGAVRNYRIKNDIPAAGRMPKAEITRLIAELRSLIPREDEDEDEEVEEDDALPPEPGEPEAAKPAAAAPVVAPTRAAAPRAKVEAGSARAWRFTVDGNESPFIVVAKTLVDAVQRATEAAGGDEAAIRGVETLGAVLTANL